MRAYIVHQSIEHEKFNSTRVWAAFYDQPLLSYEGFCKISCFLEEKNTEIQEDFEQFFVTKQGFLASKKYKKYSFWLYNSYTTYLTKAKSRSLSLFTKNTQI